MRITRCLTLLLGLGTLAACDPASAPLPTEAASRQLLAAKAVQHTVTGDYTVNAAADPTALIPSHFEIGARVFGDGSAAGTFSWFIEISAGTVDIEGEVICMPVDAELGRAWIGAVVTRNSSTLGAFQQDRHQPGRDVWFRIADVSPGGSGDADRSTATAGFEGSGGVVTSQEYCELKIWPNDGRPILSGNLTVR